MKAYKLKRCRSVLDATHLSDDKFVNEFVKSCNKDCKDESYICLKDIKHLEKGDVLVLNINSSYNCLFEDMVRKESTDLGKLSSDFLLRKVDVIKNELSSVDSLDSLFQQRNLTRKLCVSVLLIDMAGNCVINIDSKNCKIETSYVGYLTSTISDNNTNTLLYRSIIKVIKSTYGDLKLDVERIALSDIVLDDESRRPYLLAVAGVDGVLEKRTSKQITNRCNSGKTKLVRCSDLDLVMASGHLRMSGVVKHHLQSEYNYLVCDSF